MNGWHHLHLRKRIFDRLEEYPSQDVLKRWFDRIMYGVSIGIPLALVPQVARVYETQNVADLSLTTWLLLGFFNILWTAYGVLHKAYPVLISSVASGLLQFSLVFAILLFR